MPEISAVSSARGSEVGRNSPPTNVRDFAVIAEGATGPYFDLFVLLAFLLYYRDWRPIVAAAALIAVHHLAFNYMQAAGMVMDHTTDCDRYHALRG